ncbi:MAG: response regulator [Leptolyngbyaceae cyanobacterium bins.59]|nr:response regulator [Leptolyngbyaceae cyanobacterium bins.59]
MVKNPFSPARILLVDENITFLTMLSEALQIRFERLEIISCTSGRAALLKVEVLELDAIVCNVKLPDMDGLSFLEAVQYRQPALPVLLVASYDDGYLVSKTAQYGAYDIVHKPIDWDLFEASLGSAIYIRQIERLRNQITQQQSQAYNLSLLEGIKVLVVDDDRSSGEMQSASLRSCGAEVRTAESVRSALEVLQDFEPDLILSDIRMPYEDGYSLVRKLRRGSVGGCGRVPAIAITAYAQEEDRRHSLQAGFQLQMAKPIDPKTLALTVANLTGRIS